MVLTLLVVVIALCLIGIRAHYYYYKSLYQQLNARQVIGTEYCPTWAEYLGSWGCMGFLQKLRREVEASQLTESDQALIRNVSVTYYASVPTLFIATVAIFWWLNR